MFDRLAVDWLECESVDDGRLCVDEYEASTLAELNSIPP
jgi:hypothetical protein